MLAALGQLILTLVQPMNVMGNYLGASPADLQAYTGLNPLAPMSTQAFTAFAAPWIQYAGPMAQGAATFLSSLVAWFSSLSAFMRTF